MSWIKRLIPSAIKKYYWKRIYKRNHEKENKEFQSESVSNPLLESYIKDGLLRVRITHKCNSRCRWCGQLGWSQAFQQAEMPTEWYMEYLKPIYAEIKTLLLTGGDPLVARNSFEFCQMMVREFPAVNILLETNGIAFSEKWQKLSLENLNIVHFSVNASDPDVFARGVWAGENGQIAFRTVRKNYEAYYALLKEHHLEVFAPDVSMVINKDTASDVRNFMKQALKWRVNSCTYFFDYSETSPSCDYFIYPEITEPVLRECYEMERVLNGLFVVKFRLFLSKGLSCRRKIEKEVYDLPIEELQEKYRDLLELAEGRSVQREFEERQRIRLEHGKKTYTLDEEYTPTVSRFELGGQKVCMAPWKLLDVFPNGGISACSWVNYSLKLQNFIQDGRVNWDGVLNSPELKRLRFRHLHHNYEDCMTCCPLNPTLLDIDTDKVQNKGGCEK